RDRARRPARCGRTRPPSDCTGAAASARRLGPLGRGLLVGVVARVVARVVVVVSPFELHVVEDDAEDVRAHVLQLLLGAAHDRSRRATAVDDEHHAVNHRREYRGVCEGDCGRRVNDDVREVLRQKIEELAHLFGAEEMRKLLYLLTENLDRKSTRLNSSHSQISYAVFCLKKKKTNLL